MRIRTLVVAAVVVAAAALAPYAEAVTVTLNFAVTPDPNSGQIAVVNGTNDFTNCLATQGCFAKTGLGGNPIGTNALLLPDTLSYTFVLPQPAGGNGTLTAVASRDIGHRVGEAATDFLVTTSGATNLGSLFLNTVSPCPLGESGGLLNGVPCGPNFHDDIQATDSVAVPQGLLSGATLAVVLNPTDDVGRLKLFSLTLDYPAVATTTVPEPTTGLVFGTGALILAARRALRRRRTAR
ncbi:MAG TPA: hypothetical protein VGL09_03440 [Methylomirabilota bacterium]|jgi:hypothetical protein